MGKTRVAAESIRTREFLLGFGLEMAGGLGRSWLRRGPSTAAGAMRLRLPSLRMTSSFERDVAARGLEGMLPCFLARLLGRWRLPGGFRLRLMRKDCVKLCSG